MTIQITRSGITWEIAGNPTSGTYMNGDPWVVGPVSVTNITPLSVATGGGRIINGSEKNLRRRNNPAATWDDFLQGFDSLPSCAYDNTINVGRALPIALAAGDSLVSTESDPNQTSSYLSAINRAAVLTVVAAPPAANEFRPPYWYPTRPAAPYAWDDSMLDQLPSVFPASYGASIATMASRMQQLWLSVGFNEASWRVMPQLQCHGYYRERNIELGYMMMALCSAIPKLQKRALAIALCQYGIDLAWAVKNGQYFASRHSTGRKAPIVLMAHITGFADFADVNALCPVGTWDPYNDPYALAQDHRVVWGEDGQTFVVAETSPGVYNWGKGRYTIQHVGQPEWGNDHWMLQGDTDWSDWLSEEGIRGYRKCCSANGWLGQQLAMRAMGLIRAWGHDPYFDYLARYLKIAPSIGFPSWQLDFTGALLPVWQQYGADLALNGRSIGLAGPGAPRMEQLTVAGTESPWQLRINSGQSVPVAGVLIRSSDASLRPRRSFWGVSTNGLVFLDEAGYQGHIPILVMPGGTTFNLPAIDDAGVSYVVQAALIINDELVTTNAIQTTVVDGV